MFLNIVWKTEALIAVSKSVGKLAAAQIAVQR